VVLQIDFLEHPGGNNINFRYLVLCRKIVLSKMFNVQFYTKYLHPYEGKRLLGRTICRWEDNIKVDLKEMGCEDVDWI
jgi:hypothetical protein